MAEILKYILYLILIAIATLFGWKLYDYLYNSDIQKLNDRLDKIESNVYINQYKLDSVKRSVDSIVEAMHKLRYEVDSHFFIIENNQDTIKNDLKLIKREIIKDKRQSTSERGSGIYWVIPNNK